MNDSSRPITPSAIEIGKLLAITDRDLSQAAIDNLHLDTRFALAYNAALQLATVVLRLHGTRIRKTGFHERTFQALEPHLPPSMRTFADYFDRASQAQHAFLRSCQRRKCKRSRRPDRAGEGLRRLGHGGGRTVEPRLDLIRLLPRWLRCTTPILDETQLLVYKPGIVATVQGAPCPSE